MKWPWSKNKRLLELESQVIDLQRQLAAKETQITYLIRTIRGMDDIIFSISQCTSWESMRPRVAQLTDQMTSRKVAENDRISSLIQGELHQTYDQQQIEHKK